MANETHAAQYRDWLTQPYDANTAYPKVVREYHAGRRRDLDYGGNRRPSRCRVLEFADGSKLTIPRGGVMTVTA